MDVKKINGKQSYTGSYAHGITSQDFGASDRSIVFQGKELALGFSISIFGVVIMLHIELAFELKSRSHTNSSLCYRRGSSGLLERLAGLAGLVLLHSEGVG